MLNRRRKVLLALSRGVLILTKLFTVEKKGGIAGYTEFN